MQDVRLLLQYPFLVFVKSKFLEGQGQIVALGKGDWNRLLESDPEFPRLPKGALNPA